MLNIESNTLKLSISGLRGIYGKDITPENIVPFCTAFHRSLPAGKVAIARDNRSTGEAISQLVLGTLMACGRDTFNLGILPTPTLKSYININKFAGGIMISASHNPVEYAAFKFIKSRGHFFSERENLRWINELEKDIVWPNHKKQGRTFEAYSQGMQLHIKDITERLPLKKKMKFKIALDSVGACGTKIGVHFLEHLGAEVYPLYPDVLDYFPRPPEPTQNSLKKLSELVREKKCDIGFGLDPDADRLVAVSEKGEVLSEEYTLPITAFEAMKKYRYGIVTNLSSSWLNRWLAEQFSQKIFLSSVGEANVVQLMQQKKMNFGGEGNGGVIDLELASQGRDSISAMGWLLAAMYNNNKNLSELKGYFPQTYMKKIKIKVVKEETPKILEKIKNRIRKEMPELKINQRDGLHFSARQGIPWIHIRESNTEPMIRIIAEAQSKPALKMLINLLN